MTEISATALSVALRLAPACRSLAAVDLSMLCATSASASANGVWSSKPSSASMAGGKALRTRACASSTTRRFGFVRVDWPQRGDMIVMHAGRTVHPNHAGIYLGTDTALPSEESGTFGPGPFLLHHLYGRRQKLSSTADPGMTGRAWSSSTKTQNNQHDAAVPPGRHWHSIHAGRPDSG